MSIFALHILPPFAIGRLGSAPDPVDNYTIEVNPEHPLDFRNVKGAETLIVDEASGRISGTRIPKALELKQNGRMRPVAPFLEVFAQTHADPSKALEPLTLELLKEHGLRESDICWRVRVANRKVVRRTTLIDDSVAADTGWFSSHKAQSLRGYCKHFVSSEKFIDFGRVQYILPKDPFPEIRLRFTPAQGLIYGPNIGDEARNWGPNIYQVPPERQIYDKNHAWYMFNPANPTTGAFTYPPIPIETPAKDFYNDTMPPDLFAIWPPAPSWLYDHPIESRGYLDDACDGVVEVGLTLKDGRRLEAFARICAGAPVVVPDALFVRTLADDLEQAAEGPQVSSSEPAELRARAEDIIQRAYETVRYLNVAVMNGNPPEGRPPLQFDTMPAGEAFATDRMERPVMPPETVDTLAILALHQQVFTAMRSGAAPWFLRFLRKPEKAADFTDEGRRKMPALMCGADSNYLALTRRQIDTIRAASTLSFPPEPQSAATGLSPTEVPQALTPRNRTAHINYVAAGNPISSRPVNAIANCCPGLEVDFRAVWRRILEGITMREYDNLVLDVDPQQDDPGKLNLKGHRLLRINQVKCMAQAIGPDPADRFGHVVLSMEGNEDGVQPLEWSNLLAPILHEYAGKSVKCDFTAKPVWDDQVWWDDKKPPAHITFSFKLRPLFEEDTAVISRALAEPGELTQGLCSPWQNDYRECSCYYWAAARPDYVNVVPSHDGLSQGDNWLQKEHTGQYVPDDYVDSRMVLYDDLFKDWEKWLRVVMRGRDVPKKSGDKH